MFLDFNTPDDEKENIGLQNTQAHGPLKYNFIKMEYV